MTKTRALVRQWTLLRVLSQHAGGLSICEMARHTSVNERTIRRDLKLFVEAGIPLRERVVRQNKKIWRIDYRGAMVTANFSAKDALALAIAERYFATLKGTGFYDAIERCRENIVANLSVSQRKRLDEQADRLEMETRTEALLPICERTINTLWEALDKGSIPEQNGDAKFAHS